MRAPGGAFDGDQVPRPLASASPPPLTFQGGLAQSLAQKPLHSVKRPQACAVGPGQVANALCLDHFFSGLRWARGLGMRLDASWRVVSL